MKYIILAFLNMVCGYLMMYFYGEECSENENAYKKMLNLNELLAALNFVAAGICIEKIWN